ERHSAMAKPVFSVASYNTYLLVANYRDAAGACAVTCRIPAQLQNWENPLLCFISPCSSPSIMTGAPGVILAHGGVGLVSVMLRFSYFSRSNDFTTTATVAVHLSPPPFLSRAWTGWLFWSFLSARSIFGSTARKMPGRPKVLTK